MFTRLTGRARSRLPVGIGLVLLALAAACGSGNSVGVQYHGYSFTPSPASFKSGTVTFNLDNKDGQVLHEFVVVQTDLPADKLPLGQDGKVDESGLKVAGRASQIDVGQTGALTVNLAPGHYVLMCNIVGHYQLGMHSDFTVTQ